MSETSIDAEGNVTTVTTYLNDTTTSSVSARDGRLLETVDQAGIKTAYDYGFILDEELGYQTPYQSTTRNGTTATTITDFQGNTVKSTSRAGRVTRQYFSNFGELIKSVNYNGSVQLYEYDRPNNISVSALDVNANGIIDYGIDIINRTEADYLKGQNQDIWQRQRSWSKPASLDTPGAPDATQLSSLDGLNSQTITAESGTATTSVNRTFNNDIMTLVVTSTNPDSSQTIRTSLDGLDQSIVVKDANGAEQASTSYSYDYLRHLEETTDTRNGTTTYGYDALDRVETLTTPSPGTAGVPRLCEKQKKLV